MKPKERVLTAFAHHEPDRIPLDYSANAGIDQRLKRHFSLKSDDDEGLLRCLGIDFRYVWPPYIGPALHEDFPGRTVDLWGIHRRWIEHESGGYWDYCDFPLRDATLEMVANWPMPDPDDFDYDFIARACHNYADYCVVAGNAGVGDIINSTGMIRTMEQVLVDLISNDPAGMLLIDRKLEVMLAITERVLDAGKNRIDLFFMGEDLGTQLGPMVSKPLFRKQLRPRLSKFVDLAKAYHLPVMFHSCGSSSWAFYDFIDMGIDIIDTLQPEAANMAPAYLKENFGKRLSFHGSISTGGPIAFGTPKEVSEYVAGTISVMMPGGGYAFAPSHALQDNSPTENVLAMYRTAIEVGRY